MGKIKKKGTSGNAKNYLTRSQAVRKLQISLGDFRRLCIFKGIYPREPRSKKRVSKSSTPSTTFYYAKDIQYLLHEPLLASFRDQKALSRKISRALGKNEISDALRWEKTLTPTLSLDHLIRERYPTFADALRDLDDALSLLFLFANLPSTADVPARVIARCRRLTMEFEHYLIRTNALRKSFLSIKGIYYQATIQGTDVLWLVPYNFVQRTGGDVDFRIMATFVHFYTTLLGFVNFRLYTGVGLVYPPRFDMQSEEAGAGLAAFRLEAPGEDGQEVTETTGDAEANQKAQAEADRLGTTPEIAPVSAEAPAEAQDLDANPAADSAATSLDQFSAIDATADTLLQPSATADSSVAAGLFEPFTFFLSRETPRHPLEFILKAFGCKRVGWDNLTGEAGSYCPEDDSRITHQVVDRPDLPLPSPPPTDSEMDDEEEGAVVKRSNERVPGRIYVQPQWVWDSINLGQLQRPDLYAPGATLPPHLSPWVKPKAGEYDPTVPLAAQETAAEAELEDEDEVDEGSEGEEVEGVRGDEEAQAMIEELGNANAGEIEEEDSEDGGMDVQLAASDSEEDDEESEDEVNDEWGGLSGDEEDVDDATREARDHQLELEAEAQGASVPQPKTRAQATKQAAQVSRDKAEREAKEDVERRKMMMPRRKRKMYEKMVYSNARKDEEAEKLRSKRRKLEKAAMKGKA